MSTILLVVLLVLLVLLLLGVPVAVSLAASGVLAFVLESGATTGLNSLAQTSYAGVYSFVLIAIPLYILMGEILVRGGVGTELYDLAQRIVGNLPGGIGVATIFACAIFGSVSGSSSATVATVGSVALPEMSRRGFSRKLSAGSLAMAGSLGILIPPSIPMVIYALVADVSPGQLFLAGILPGIMLTTLFCLYTIGHVALQKGDSSNLRFSQGEQRKKAGWTTLVRRSFGGLGLIPIILGGIYAGWYTPTEAASVGVVYCLVLTIFVKRSLGRAQLYEAARSAVSSSAMILMLVMGASIFGTAMSLLNVPQDVAAAISGLQLQQWEFLLIMMLLYLILGTALDTSATILITVPVLLPVLEALDINLIWFGVILVINMEIGTVTPPLGLNINVIQGLQEDYEVGEILWGTLPYVLLALLGIILIIVFPGIALLFAQGGR